MKRYVAPSLVAVVTLLAAALKLRIALTTYGTSDVWYWEQYLAGVRTIDAIELYRTDPNFNHPPFMAHALLAMGALADRTGTPFPFWLRLPAIVADAVSVWLVWRLVKARGCPPLAGCAGVWSVVLLAASPASVMISGYHGNTDPAMICFVLVSVYLWERWRNAPLAGAAVGMALNVKAVPLVFLPALFLYVPGWRRLVYVAVAALVVFAGSLPYLLQDPAIIARKVLGYGSYYGHWGLSRILSELAPGGGLAALLNDLFVANGRYVALGLPALAAVAMNAPHLLRKAARPPLYVQCGVMASLFLAVTPGFGVQYLAWLVPWVPAAGALVSAAFFASTGLFLFSVYHYWSGSFPWHTADARPYEFEWWPRPVVNLELLAWASVLVVLGALSAIAVRSMRRDPGALP